VVVVCARFCQFSDLKGLVCTPWRKGAFHQEERPKTNLSGLSDWDAARIFLEVVRCGSFRSAAERLSLSINAVRRGSTISSARPAPPCSPATSTAPTLTDEGRLVVSAVERMEAAPSTCCAPAIRRQRLSGEVRVAVTEGLGTFWLRPRLVEFQQAYPKILVDLHCAMRSADVSRHEADVAIHLSRPSALDVKLVRLGRMHLMFWASEKYIEKHGAPRSAMN
jgi:DNA-binding transcriptional LysR family regulator